MSNKIIHILLDMSITLTMHLLNKDLNIRLN